MARAKARTVLFLINAIYPFIVAKTVSDQIQSHL